MTDKAPASLWWSFAIYTLLYEALVIGGCGYIVFVLGHSGWWWLLAMLFSAGQWRPSQWHAMWTGRFPLKDTHNE